jgi:hypothetical protein
MKTQSITSLFLAIFSFALVTPAIAQSGTPVPQSINVPPPMSRTISLSGPRFGFTSLSPGITAKLASDHNIDVGPLISQFGWQFERSFFTRGSGVAAISEVVVLVGGLEQSVALPSVSWLVGLRTSQGAEFGIGPNITPAGAALALAAGMTLRSGSLNIPMTFAVVPSKSGVRVSILTGFTMRRN